MSVPTLLIRLTIAFITLLLLTRIMGRKEISQMTFFNFISAISIGTIGASLAVDNTISFRNGFIALLGWSIFTIVLGWLNIKSDTARKLITGEPIVLIKNGKIIEGNLKKTRLDIEGLLSMLRKKDIFSMKEVDYAIFETDGELSVLKKADMQPLTKKEAGTSSSQTKVFTLPTSLITDRQVLHGNLEKLNLNEKWLDNQLQMAGVQSVDKVFYAEVQEDGSLYVDLAENELN